MNGFIINEVLMFVQKTSAVRRTSASFALSLSLKL